MLTEVLCFPIRKYEHKNAFKKTGIVRYLSKRYKRIGPRGVKIDQWKDGSKAVTTDMQVKNVFVFKKRQKKAKKFFLCAKSRRNYIKKRRK